MMIDNRSPESHSGRHRHLRRSGPERRGSAGLAEPARSPGHGGLGRWLLDALVVGFAYGGCIHHTHQSYVHWLREQSRAQWR
ncbi:hypothetical protein [Methylobacterium aquaticum]|nr:hypothetical protein [Methylobacterium aquaticum]